MTQFEFDWPYVRRHTMRPALSVLVAAALLIVAIWLHDEQQRQFDELADNHDAVHQDYDALVRQRRLVDRYHRRYQKLHDLGFIGHESRLDWVEAMRMTSNSMELPRLTYAIEPQLQVVPPVQSVFGDEDVQLRASKAQLEMGLLHELDLLRFFNTLQENAPGLIKVDTCELAWQAEPGARVANDVNLSATCSIQLFSVITSDVLPSRVQAEGSAYE